MSRRRVLLAPDKFKGSLTAAQVADALRAGILRVAPDLDVRTAPVADGGEGTLEAALSAGFARVELTASGPTGEPVRTAFARRGDTAVVEMADVSGLARLPGGRLAPLTATSRGTGEVIAAAVSAGCREIVLGIGGSACTDGGAGMVQALGARLLDRSGAAPASGGAALAALERLDPAPLTRLAGVRIVVACDVDNPLLGPSGAAAVYGPQKGAGPDEVEVLDGALAHWADVVAAAVGEDRRDAPGAGAAGGVGFAALALLGAELRPGIDLLLDLLGFDDLLDGVDCVVVGEGAIDEQTLHGKAPVGVAARARARGARVVGVCGVQRVEADRLEAAGIEEVHALTELEPDPERCVAEAGRLLALLGERLAGSGALGAVASGSPLNVTSREARADPL